MAGELTRFEVLEPIGRGGMALVSRAVQRGAGGFEREIALKQMLPQLRADPDLVRRFIGEARVGSQLCHPNIAQVFDFGRSGDEYFIAMELVDGLSLGELLRAARGLDRPLPYPVIASLLLQLASALAHVHGRTGADGSPLGLAHRDISPSNVLVTHDGHVKLIDFGVCGGAALVKAGVVGKLGYMAPEELGGGRVDQRSDLWALGVVGWELVCGRRLFRGQTRPGTIEKVLRGPIPVPSRVGDGCPLAIERLIMALLERDPNARLQRAADVAEWLDSWGVSVGVPLHHRTVRRWLQNDSTTPTPVGQAVGTPPMTLDAIASDVDIETIAQPSATPAAWPTVTIGERVEAPRGRWAAIAAVAIAAGALAGYAGSRAGRAGVSAAGPGVPVKVSAAGPGVPVSKPKFTVSGRIAGESPRVEQSASTREKPAPTDSAPSYSVGPDRSPETGRSLPKAKSSDNDRRRARAEKQPRDREAKRNPRERQADDDALLEGELDLVVKHERRTTAAAALFRDVSAVTVPNTTSERDARPADERPQTVPASSVKKLSGSVPTLTLRRNSRERADGVTAVARFCTDRSGNVTSLRIRGSGPSEAMKQLRSALRRWTFRPVKRAGQTVPACFSKRLRIAAR